MKLKTIFFTVAIAVFLFIFGVPAFAGEVTTDTIEEETEEKNEPTDIEKLLEDATPEQVAYIREKIENVLNGLEGYNITGWDRFSNFVITHINVISWAIFGIGIILYMFVYISKNKALKRELTILNNNSVEIARASHADSENSKRIVEGYAENVRHLESSMADLAEKVNDTLKMQAQYIEASESDAEKNQELRKSECDAIILVADSLAAIVQCSKIDDVKKNLILSNFETAKSMIGGETDEKTGS